MAFPEPQRSRKRRILILIPLVLVAYVIWRIVYTPSQPGMDPNAAMPASVADAIVRNVTLWKEFSGRLEAVDIAEVRTRVPGEITKIMFKDGDTVKKGQPLIVIDQAPYQAAAKQAEGQLAAAKAAAANAGLDANRAVKLWEAKAISKSMYDSRIAAAQSARGNVKAAEGALQAALTNLRYTVITAPIAGKTSRAEVTLGNLVDSTPVLTTIVAQSPLYVSFEADEQTYLTFIRSNENRDIPVQMGLSNEDGFPHAGKISSFDNRLDPVSGTMRVRAVFDNADGLLVPGLYARVRIGTPDTQPSILVNEKAISTDQTSKYVFTLDKDSKATYTPVTLGGTEDGLRVVTSGVKAGDKIVVNGLARTRPGAKIQPVPADMQTLKPLNPPAGTAPAAPEAKEAK